MTEAKDTDPNATALLIFVEHFTGGKQADHAQLGRAMAALGVARDWEALGHAIYRAALHVNLARLRAARAAAVAKLDVLEGRDPAAPPSLH